MSTERVNHPQHYGGDTTYEAIKVIEAWELGFCLGNAVKYICRAGRKDQHSELEDLRKATWYLQREIAAWEAKHVVEGWHDGAEAQVAGHSRAICTPDFCGRERG